MKLSVVFSSKNEEKIIGQSLKSVSFADEIIVVDSESTDNTAQVARNLGAKVIIRPDPGIRNQKQFALEQGSGDWILALDPDEIITPALQQEILSVINSQTDLSGFQIPRIHRFLGKWIKYGKGIDYPMRLVRKNSAEYTHRLPHEAIMVKGKTGFLKNFMEHESSPDISKRIWKIQKETELELQNLPSRPPTFKELFLNPVIFFVSMAIKKKGWKDGFPGLILIALFSVQYFLMQAKFYEKHLEKTPPKS